MARILTVDDDEASLALVGGLLRDGGHELISFSDPRQLVAMATPPAIDAAIIDLSMPFVSGWQVLEYLRSHPRTRGAPVLLLSASSDTETRVRGLRAGADDFVSKPFAPAELLARLETALGRRMSPAARLQGDLAEGTLAQVLQNLAQARESGDVEVSTAHGTGWIKVRDGRLAAVEFGHWRDAEALYALFEQTHGSFRLTEAEAADETHPVPSSRRSIDSLLLAAAWIEDELAARERFVPPLDAELRFVRPAREVPEGFDGIGVSMLADAVASGEVRTFAEWLPRSRWAPRRSLLALAWLLEQGSLALASGLALGSSAASVRSRNEPEDAEIESVLAALGGREAMARTAGSETSGSGGVAIAIAAASWQERLLRLTSRAGGLSARRQPLGLTVWVETAAWGEVASLQAELAQEAQALASPQRAKATRGETRRFRLAFGDGVVEVALLNGPQEWQSERDPFGRTLALFAYWGSHAAQAERWPILKRLEARAPEATRLVLIGNGQSAERAGSRWQVAASAPTSIAALLDLALAG